jgi:hypothetical protein
VINWNIQPGKREEELTLIQRAAVASRVVTSMAGYPSYRHDSSSDFVSNLSSNGSGAEGGRPPV